MTDALGALTAFGRALRREGVPVGTGRIACFCRAAALLSPEDLYWAGRATLVGRRDQIPVYDRVFRTFFGLGASIFDFDGDGNTNSNDFAEFRKRFGLMI